MIHPASRLVPISDAIGDGMVCTEPIPRGTIVWAQDRFDIVVAATEFPTLRPELRAILDHFAHQDGQGNRIMCWDGGRHVNHACTPSMRGIGASMMVAVRDLVPGDELTCDYAECYLDAPLACACGAAACRKIISRDDLITHALSWDAEVRALCRAARTVAQPLWPYLLSPAQSRRYIWEDAGPPSFATLFHAV